MRRLWIVTLFVLVGMTGCESENVNIVEPETQAAQVKKTYCKDPRPQMCTREYRPVCGKPTHKTYSNGCTACADTEVQYHIAEKCE